MNETLTPRDLTAEGKAAYAAKKYPEAGAVFERANRAYMAAGDFLNAAEAANNASVAWLQAGDPEKALLLAAGTETTFETAGDLLRQGIALANQAAALDGLNRKQEALDYYQRAAEYLKQAGENEMRAMVLKNISTLQLQTGGHLQALASMDAALDQKKKLSLRERLLKLLLRVPFDMMNRK